MGFVEKNIRCRDCNSSLVGQKVGATSTQRCNSCHHKRTASYSGVYCQYCSRKTTEVAPGNRCGDCYSAGATSPRVATEQTLYQQHRTHPKLVGKNLSSARGSSSGGCVVFIGLLLSCLGAFMGMMALVN